MATEKVTVVSDKYRGTADYDLVLGELVRAAQYRGLTTYQDIALLVGLPQYGQHMGKEIGLILMTVGVVGIGGALFFGCSGPPDSASAPDEPAGIVSDRFELRWELDGEDLLLAIDTDLPDEGELSISVGRSYYEVGNDAEYSRDYLSVFEPVSRWREPRRVPLDANAWRADLAAHQGRMAEIAAAERRAGVPAEDTIAFEVASIADDVEIRAVLHVNQDDPRFGGRGNPNLSGAATSPDPGVGLIVEAEATFEFPLE